MATFPAASVYRAAGRMATAVARPFGGAIIAGMKEHPDCLVIGAGPAGLAAAIASARGGLSVNVIEKNDRPGKKLLITGDGRCNLTDPDAPADHAVYGPSGKSLRQALGAFSLAGFLQSIDVKLERDNGGLFFVRGGARRMLEALLAEAGRLGVEIITNAAVTSASILETGGFDVATARGKFRAQKRLIIAAGGITYPSTGSSGDGYQLAESFGLETKTPRPALGELVLRSPFPELAGVPVPDAILKSGKRKSRGALLFTHRGLSGPAALQMSLLLARAEATQGAPLIVDLAPETSREELLAALASRARAEGRRTLKHSGLKALPLPARVALELARRAKLDPGRRMAGLGRKDFSALIDAVKALYLVVEKAPRPEESMVTVGGVVIKDLDPRTLESRRVPGLRFAGEVLAPAGPCGGYNMFMAFATGTAAGS